MHLFNFYESQSCSWRYFWLGKGAGYGAAGKVLCLGRQVLIWILSGGDKGCKARSQGCFGLWVTDLPDEAINISFDLEGFSTSAAVV